MQLARDPFNMVITGVGGQGNVMASRVLAGMLARKGFYVTIGETFGASQRGGSVMSHLRVSEASVWSPQIPRKRADVVLALEPSEAIRVLKVYGNEQIKVLANTRPVHPVGVIAGRLKYPSLEEIKKAVHELSARAWFIDATDEAMKLGNPIFGNIMMLGALSKMHDLPLDREDFEHVILDTLPATKLGVNLKAFDLGASMLTI